MAPGIRLSTERTTVAVPATAKQAMPRCNHRGLRAGGIMAKGSVLRRCFLASQDRSLTLAASHVLDG